MEAVRYATGAFDTMRRKNKVFQGNRSERDIVLGTLARIVVFYFDASR